MNDDTRPQLCGFQVSPALLVIVLLVASVGGWFFLKMQQAKRQKDAVAAIEQSGGWVEYDYQVDAGWCFHPERQPPAPEWLREIVGDDFFCSVIVVAGKLGIKGGQWIFSRTCLTSNTCTWQLAYRRR